MMESDPDATLLAAVAARDQRALRILMGRHMERAIRVAERIVHNAADADEIGQEAFFRVWNRASSYDPKIARFTTWFYRIVVNLALDRRRHPGSDPLEDAADVRSGEPDAVDVLIEEEERKMVANALVALSARQRAAIALFHMEGLSARDAASAMSLSDKAFESLLTRARLTLKQQIAVLQQVRRRGT